MCILLPETTEQLVEIVSYAHREGVPLVPSGGRTGYSGGATASHYEVVVSLANFAKRVQVDPMAHTASCDAGATTLSIQVSARDAGLFYPVDLASRGSSQIGGNIATNAGGIRVLRYGDTRKRVLGLTVVVAPGRIVELNGALIKNQAGYDLRQLMIGSEGTLGFVSGAILQLEPSPKPTVRFLCGLSDNENILEVLRCLRTQGHQVCLFEYFEHPALTLVLDSANFARPFSRPHHSYLLCEIEGEEELLLTDKIGQDLSQLIDRGLVQDLVLAQNTKQSEELLHLREHISPSIMKRYFVHKNDVSVPVAVVPNFLRALEELCERKMKYTPRIVFGHVGDGNLHVNFLKLPEQDRESFAELCKFIDHEVFTLVTSLRGSVSAEHGIGLLKRDHLHLSRSPWEIQMMQHIKRIFDPKGIFNPGKVFPSLAASA
jgi:FAD/FMN-containing dehydrogenase